MRARIKGLWKVLFGRTTIFVFLILIQLIVIVAGIGFLGTKVLVMDAGRIQQHATPEEILARPATEFVSRLVSRQRHACSLDEEHLFDCGHSGAARAKAAMASKEA